MAEYFIDGHKIDSGVNDFGLNDNYAVASFSNVSLNGFSERLKDKCVYGECVDIAISDQGERISFSAVITSIEQTNKDKYTFSAQSIGEWLVTKIDELESK